MKHFARFSRTKIFETLKKFPPSLNYRNLWEYPCLFVCTELFFQIFCCFCSLWGCERWVSTLFCSSFSFHLPYLTCFLKFRFQKSVLSRLWNPLFKALNEWQSHWFLGNFHIHLFTSLQNKLPPIFWQLIKM